MITHAIKSKGAQSAPLLAASGHFIRFRFSIFDFLYCTSSRCSFVPRSVVNHLSPYSCDSG